MYIFNWDFKLTDKNLEQFPLDIFRQDDKDLSNSSPNQNDDEAVQAFLEKMRISRTYNRTPKDFFDFLDKSVLLTEEQKTNVNHSKKQFITNNELYTTGYQGAAFEFYKILTDPNGYYRCPKQAALAMVIALGCGETLFDNAAQEEIAKGLGTPYSNPKILYKEEDDILIKLVKKELGLVFVEKESITEARYDEKNIYYQFLRPIAIENKNEKKSSIIGYESVLITISKDFQLQNISKMEEFSVEAKTYFYEEKLEEWKKDFDIKLFSKNCEQEPIILKKPKALPIFINEHISQNDAEMLDTLVSQNSDDQAFVQDIIRNGGNFNGHNFIGFNEKSIYKNRSSSKRSNYFHDGQSNANELSQNQLTQTFLGYCGFNPHHQKNLIGQYNQNINGLVYRIIKDKLISHNMSSKEYKGIQLDCPAELEYEQTSDAITLNDSQYLNISTFQNMRLKLTIAKSGKDKINEFRKIYGIYINNIEENIVEIKIPGQYITKQLCIIDKNNNPSNTKIDIECSNTILLELFRGNIYELTPTMLEFASFQEKLQKDMNDLSKSDEMRTHATVILQSILMLWHRSPLAPTNVQEKIIDIQNKLTQMSNFKEYVKAYELEDQTVFDNDAPPRVEVETTKVMSVQENPHTAKSELPPSARVTEISSQAIPQENRTEISNEILSEIVETNTIERRQDKPKIQQVEIRQTNVVSKNDNTGTKDEILPNSSESSRGEAKPTRLVNGQNDKGAILHLTQKEYFEKKYDQLEAFKKHPGLTEDQIKNIDKFFENILDEVNKTKLDKRTEVFYSKQLAKINKKFPFFTANQFTKLVKFGEYSLKEFIKSFRYFVSDVGLLNNKNIPAEKINSFLKKAFDQFNFFEMKEEDWHEVIHILSQNGFPLINFDLSNGLFELSHKALDESEKAKINLFRRFMLELSNKIAEAKSVQVEEIVSGELNILMKKDHDVYSFIIRKKIDDEINIKSKEQFNNISEEISLSYNQKKSDKYKKLLDLFKALKENFNCHEKEKIIKDINDLIKDKIFYEFSSKNPFKRFFRYIFGLKPDSYYVICEIKKHFSVLEKHISIAMPTIEEIDKKENIEKRINQANLKEENIEPITDFVFNNDDKRNKNKHAYNISYKYDKQNNFYYFREIQNEIENKYESKSKVYFQEDERTQLFNNP